VLVTLTDNISFFSVFARHKTRVEQTWEGENQRTNKQQNTTGVGGLWLRHLI